MTCFKEELRICKLPQEANADRPKEHCLMTALDGQNRGQILNSCELVSISYTQVKQDSISLADLAQTESKVKGGSNFVNATLNFQVGALKVTLGCGCQLELKSRVIAKSQRVVLSVTFHGNHSAYSSYSYECHEYGLGSIS
ncbi:unnamed protein product [Orchesella dallaii]|uniref:Uncharacterized protein n=1 Tax=Orchesella dallaii TaxID=48710 RepID=A0ABP1RQL3_9HEXA